MTYNPLGRRNVRPISPVAPESTPFARRLPMTFDYAAHKERMFRILYPQPKALTDEGLPNLAENIKKMAGKKR